MPREPDGLRRQNFGVMAHKLERQMLKWRYTMPAYRMRVGQWDETPPMGQMDHAQIRHWALRATRHDAESSINQTAAAEPRSKARAGEAL